jgi:transaldolase
VVSQAVGASTRRRAVFLDRDGVLTVPEFRDGRSYAPRTLEAFRLYPDVASCVGDLKRAGFVVIVATNQPDVGAGIVERCIVDEMHARLRSAVAVDDIEVCYETRDQATERRKPCPGMLFSAARRWNLDLESSYLVGDRESDVVAALRAGCTPIFIDLGYREPQPTLQAATVGSLREATDWILRREALRTQERALRGEHAMTAVSDLKIKIFADGADLAGIMEMYKNPLIKGFTTNPTLMRKAGIDDYEAFGRELLSRVTDRPVSLEVFADDFDEMERQALAIASWGKNVNVKIPITNTRGVFSGPLIRSLSSQGVVLNVTAIMTPAQVKAVAECLHPDVPAIISVFAGRVADTGRDPVPLMLTCQQALYERPKAELLWASPRELLNIFQADAMGCHIITVTNDVLAKLKLVGKDLDEYSRETVDMFYRDAVASNFSIASRAAAAA